MNQGKLATILWEDACGTSGWKNANSADDDLLLVFSVGMVLRESKKTITLVQSVSAGGKDYDNSVTIPKSCILRKKIAGRVKT